jgi:hypothetical protein
MCIAMRTIENKLFQFFANCDNYYCDRLTVNWKKVLFIFSYMWKILCVSATIITFMPRSQNDTTIQKEHIFMPIMWVWNWQLLKKLMSSENDSFTACDSCHTLDCDLNFKYSNYTIPFMNRVCLKEGSTKKK